VNNKNPPPFFLFLAAFVALTQAERALGKQVFPGQRSENVLMRKKQNPPRVAGTYRKKAAIFPVPPRAVKIGDRPASPPKFTTPCFSRKFSDLETPAV
jgi:hypothetical protein